MARTREVRARVSEELKEKVAALAAVIGDLENESLVVREALVWWTQQPPVMARIEEGRAILAARREREEEERRKGGGDGKR